MHESVCWCTATVNSVYDFYYLKGPNSKRWILTQMYMYWPGKTQKERKKKMNSHVSHISSDLISCCGAFLLWLGQDFFCFFVCLGIALELGTFSIDTEEDHPSCHPPLFFVLWVMSNVSSGKIKDICNPPFCHLQRFLLCWQNLLPSKTTILHVLSESVLMPLDHYWMWS